MIVEGTLEALGTESSPIVFTSLLDDTVGGDSNGDSSNSAPRGADWGTIAVRSAATINIDNCDFRYSTTAISADDSTVTVNNTSVQDSDIAIQVSANDSPSVTNLSVTRVNFGGVVTIGVATKNATWGIGNAPVIIKEDLSVAQNVTLTINPSTVIKFISGPFRQGATGGPTGHADIIVDGTLKCTRNRKLSHYLYK